MSAPRYLLVLLREHGDADALARDLARRTGLMPAAAPRGAILLCSSPMLGIFSSPTAVLVGHLFDKKTGRSATSSDLTDPACLPGRLLEDFWGGYIAVRRTEAGDEILRDPSGALPCYHVSLPAGLALASDPQALCDAGLLIPDVDYASLARHLYGAGLPTAHTVLRGLADIPAGFRLRTSTHTIEEMWSPWRFVASDDCAAREPLEDRLARTIQNCVSAWARHHSRVLIGISGGLDSSIVAACLSRTPAQIVAATLTTTDLEGDERPFARPLARALGVELIESAYSHDHIDIGKSAAAHLPRPVARTQILAHDAAMLQFAREHRIDAFFSGNGGDNVFCLMQSSKPFVDRLLHDGPTPGVYRTLIDICRLTGCSPLQALRLAVRSWRATGRSYGWTGDRSFLSPDALYAADGSIDHPWLVAPSGALPGKAAHIAMLVRAQLTLEGFDRQRGPITINPLMAQPVVELCLSIPSWRWCAGGRNRAVARDAFADRLPPAILHRRHKGGPDGFSVEIFERNRARIAERLLNGRMRQHGLLDRAALEHAMRDRGPTTGIERVRILALLDTEAWLDHWCAMRSSMLAG